MIELIIGFVVGLLAGFVVGRHYPSCPLCEANAETEAMYEESDDPREG